MKMSSFLLYGFALLLLGMAVNRMIRDAEQNAYKVTDREIREAWSSGFERGAASVKTS